MASRLVAKGDTFWHFNHLHEVAYLGECGVTIVNQNVGCSWEFLFSGVYLGEYEEREESVLLMANANAQGLRFPWQSMNKT